VLDEKLGFQKLSSVKKEIATLFIIKQQQQHEEQHHHWM